MHLLWATPSSLPAFVVWTRETCTLISESLHFQPPKYTVFYSGK